MGPQHGIVGDTYGTDLPQTKVDKQALTEEAKMAQYSQTEEYNRIKTHAEARIEFYQRYLPNGRDITQLTSEELASMGTNWVIANAVIAEFQALLDAYQLANDVVKGP